MDMIRDFLSGKNNSIMRQKVNLSDLGLEVWFLNELEKQYDIMQNTISDLPVSSDSKFVLQYEWLAFCEAFHIDPRRDLVQYVRPDGATMEIGTGGQWRLLLLNLQVGGVPVSYPPPNPPLRLVFHVSKRAERGNGSPPLHGAPGSEVSQGQEAPRTNRGTVSELALLTPSPYGNTI